MIGRFLEVTGEDFNGSRFGRSGDQSFMALGVPSLFMFVSEQPPGQDASAGDVAALLGGPGAKGGGVGWWWHTTEDTPDKLDPDLLARDTRIYADSVHRFLCEAVLRLGHRVRFARCRFVDQRTGARTSVTRRLHR